MSNKFNQYSSGGDANVIDGSLDIFGYTLRADNLQPNEPIKSNAIGQLISSQLDISDVNNLQTELDATIQNPNNSVLVTDGLTITTGNILKTDEIHESTLGTNINLANDLYTNNIIVTGGNEIKTNNIGEATVGGGMNIVSNVDLNSNTISNVNEIKVDSIDSKAGALSVSFPSNLNSQDIICDNIREKTLLGGVNILSNVDMNSKDIQNCELIAVDSIQSKNLIDDVVCGSNLDMFVKNIKNVNDITSVNVLCDNIKEKTIAGGINILNNIDMNLKTLNNVSNVETSTLTAQGVSTQFLAPNNIFNPTTISVSGILDMSSNNITNVNDLSTTTISAKNGVSISLLDDFNVNNYDLLGVNEIKTNIISTNTTGDVNILNILDLNNNDIVNVGNMNVSTINNITPVGGLYCGISDGVIINQASGTTDLLPISSVGTLSIPSNGFSVGDAYHLLCSGIFPSSDKNDNVEVELCAVLADTSIVVLGSILIALEDFDTSPSNFELESDFVIRSVGLTGQVAVSFDFTFNKKVTEDFKGTRKTNLATLDTTQSSTLELNATISGGNGSTIKSTLAYLRKQY